MHFTARELFVTLTLIFTHYNFSRHNIYRKVLFIKIIIKFIKIQRGIIWRKILHFTITCPGNIFAECFL